MTSALTLLDLVNLLGLEDPQAAESHDVLLEWQQHHQALKLSPFLQHLGAHLGLYPSHISLHLQELRQATRQGHLICELGPQQWLLLKRDSQDKCWIYHAQAEGVKRYPFREARLRQLLGTEPRSWLKWPSHHAQQVLSSPKKSPRQRLLGFLSLESRELVLILGYALAMGILSLGVPIASQSLVNNVALGTLRQPLVALCLVLLIALGFLALLRSLQLILVEMLQRRIFVRLTQVTVERLLRLQGLYREQKRVPELINRFLDVVTVQKSVSFLLLDGLALLLQALTGLLLLALYHPFLLGFDLLLLLCLLGIVFGLGLGGESTSIKESGQKYAMVAWLEELATHPALFRSHSGMHFASWKTEKHLQAYLGARQGHFKVLLRQNIGAYALQAVAFTSLLGLGGWLVIEGQLTIGQLVAAELIVANILASFAKVGKHLETWYDLVAAFDKLGYLLDLPQERAQISLLAASPQPLGFKLEQVRCQQRGKSGQQVRLNLSCEPGQTLALRGNNTWESDTLLELLYALRQPDQGLILVDDQPLHQLNVADYRNQVALVGQLELIEGSILDNLRLGQRDLSRTGACELLKQVGLWERVQHFSEVLDTHLSYNGFPLSSSESHRLMIARALAMRPRLLMIDGTLDQIDWRSEGPISQMLFGQRDLSLLVVTNKQNLLPHFDAVYDFNAQGELELIQVSKEVKS